jgi:hypothetical protein
VLVLVVLKVLENLQANYWEMVPEMMLVVQPVYWKVREYVKVVEEEEMLKVLV